MNGAVEAGNKNIKRILRKMTDNYKCWHEQLPYPLLGYWTTARTSTGATPYFLVYGTKAVIPAEVKITSLRNIQEAELDNAEWDKCYSRECSHIKTSTKDNSLPTGKVLVVHKVLSGGAVILAEMDVQECPKIDKTK
ncbi:uncharacterized protein LOC132630960 [Lycium barbarum]|uniref:uncharacterized protein LOC132630960 n=1 Tax=Lycium barbarum TaxID=112863 RepID=UPI00293F6B54|nr:uncharacterized protein LOC132630960 [Lycium barbarum]